MVAGVVAAPPAGRADETASAALYVRSDTDHTTVVSPHLRLRAPLAEETHVDLSYTVDVWTSASVDIVASASQAVTEQRDEIDVGADQVLGDLTLGGAYRYSTEPDYESHGGSLSVSWELANKAATLAWSGGGSSDRVGRVGDASFDEKVDTFTSDLSLTQVLDRDTLLQVLYDLSIVRGYQASAYRYVAIGGDGGCGGPASFCLPERNPRERMRHAAALRARRALGDHFSLGAGYRGYLDDWGILAHTGKLDVAWVASPTATLSLDYRFYSQSAADHYKPRYLASDQGVDHFTSDKELSALSSHRVGLELDLRWELADGASALLATLAAAPTFYFYDDYPALDRVTAFEVTAVTGMELP